LLSNTISCGGGVCTHSRCFAHGASLDFAGINPINRVTPIDLAHLASIDSADGAAMLQ